MYKVYKAANNHYFVASGTSLLAWNWLSEAEAIALALTLNGVRF